MKKMVPLLSIALTVSSVPAARAQDVPTLARSGAVTQVLLTPHGDPDGLILRDGTLVRFPPHTVLEPSALRIGSEVHAEGEAAMSPSGITLFDSTVEAANRRIVDAEAEPSPGTRPPPPHERPALVPLSVAGKVRVLLSNREGVIDGFVLEDGSVVHAGPRAGLSQLGVAPSVQVVASGMGGSYDAGRSLRAETLQVANGPVLTLERKGPKGPKGAPPPR